MSKSRYMLDDKSSTKDKKTVHIAKNLIIEALLSMGILGLASCFISVSVVNIALIVTAILTLALLNLLSLSKNQFVKGIPYFAGVLAFIINPIGASRGILGFCNQIIEVWNHTFNTLVPNLKVAEITTANQLQFFVFIIIFISCGIYNQVEKNHIVSTSLMVVLTILVSARFQLSISIIGVSLMIFAWYLCWTRQLLGTQPKKMRAMMTVPVVILLIFVSMFYSSYTGNENVENLKENVKSTAESVWYGEDTLPEGNMQKANEMSSKTAKDTLELSFDSAQQMYLKGFVGCKFDGTAWDTLKYDDFSSEEISMVKWIKTQGIKTEFQYKDYFALTTNDEKDLNAVTIKNTGAKRKYLYSPYETEAVTKGSFAVNGDYQLKSTGFLGTKNYAFSTLPNVDSPESIAETNIDFSKDNAEDYNKFEHVYNSFVHSNYLDITDEEKSEINKVFYDNYDLDKSGLYDITEQIRLVLQEEITFTKKPASYSGNEDFISFILDKKEGNSAYFATLATLAYRTAGIPARYAEGYYLSSSRAELLNRDGKTSTALTTDDAHAWVEVYIDGVGWLPIEVIPGFYYAEYTSNKNANSPDSTVNIVNKTEENKLEGSTSDGVTPEESKKNDTEETTKEKVIHVVTIVIIVLAVLLLLQVLFLLRYRLLISYRKKKLENMNSVDGSRRIYKHANSVLKSAGNEIKEDFPFENVPLIIEKYPEMSEFECERFISLIQKVVFGEEELNVAEYKTIKAFDEKLTSNVYTSLDKWGKFKLKYLKALL